MKEIAIMIRDSADCAIGYQSAIEVLEDSKRLPQSMKAISGHMNVRRMWDRKCRV